MKITLPVIGWALITSLVISLCAWVWFVLHQFPVPNPLTELPRALFHTFDWPALRPIALKSLLLGFVPIGIVLWLVGDWSGNGERVLRGNRLVTSKELAKLTRLKTRKNVVPVQVTIASIPIPRMCETNHFLLAGSTGTGKTTAIYELISGILARGDRAIVIDPNADALSKFGKKGDMVLNPFDKRSPGWSPLNEIRTQYDFDRLAKSIVPDSPDANAQSWHSYAQQLLAETMRRMSQGGETSGERLLYWLTSAPTEELANFLAGSAASGLFAPNAEKALASTKFILSYHLGAYQYLRPGDFSLRAWLESSQGNLYITWREDMLSSLRPLVSSWTDILMSSMLSLATDNKRPLWLLLDELGSHQRLNSLEGSLTKGRQHSLRVVACLQAVAQLDAIYGRDNSKVLRSCFRNILALGGSNADPETATAIADGLGQIEVERTQITYSQGAGGRTSSNSIHRSVDSLVLPSQLTSLPPLHGYLKLSGDYPVASIQLTPGNYPPRVKRFSEL
jgi:DNA polymerase III delta prime subunit